MAAPKMGGEPDANSRLYRQAHTSGAVEGRGSCVRILEECLQETGPDAHREATALRDAIRRIRDDTRRHFPDARKLDPTF